MVHVRRCRTLALLFGYQWAAFGHPLFPTQRYMPPTEYSVRGWNGMTMPTFDLLWRHVFDPRYGLFVFCPMLIAAFAAPFLRESDRRPIVTRRELGFALAAGAALYVFSSANLFAYLQKDRGVRYLVPVVPLLFPVLAAVLLRLPRAAALAIVIPTAAVSWCVSMLRESVPDSTARAFTDGFQLPFLNVLRKTGGAYSSILGGVPSAVRMFCLTGIALWLLWRRRRFTPVGDPDRPGHVTTLDGIALAPTRTSGPVNGDYQPKTKAKRPA